MNLSDYYNEYRKKVEEAPYNPGYEDAVVTRRSDPVYKGMDPTKMVWKSKPLSDEKMSEILYSMGWAHDPIQFGRAIEKAHGIK